MAFPPGAGFARLCEDWYGHGVLARAKVSDPQNDRVETLERRFETRLSPGATTITRTVLGWPRRSMKVQVGLFVPAGIHLQKATAGPTSGPTPSRSHLARVGHVERALEVCCEAAPLSDRG